MRACFVFALLASLAGACPAQETVPVRFQVNDALVKSSDLEGVAIRVAAGVDGEPAAEGQTDAAGGWTVGLAPGTWYVTYTKPGYVSLEATEVEVRPGSEQVITTSLLPALESEGGDDEASGPLRIELILNWGSDATQVKDADSHLWCETSGAHVYFGTKEDYAPDGGLLSLDVDDTDWGGPETVTLHESPPGTYLYWVHDYTGGEAHLGGSDVVVRLIEGNTLLAEYRAEPTVSARAWRPFKQLVVDAQHLLTIVDWTPEELAHDEHLRLPPALDEEVQVDIDTTLTPAEALTCTGTFVGLMLAFLIAAGLIRKAF